MDASHPAHDGHLLSRRVIYKGRKFDFEVVAARTRSGRVLEREVVRHPGAVVIVPLLPDRRVVLIRNERVAVGERLWELPAGTLDPDEPPAACAARELEEETGYRAAELTPLGWFYTTPGLTDERMHAFVATGLTQVGQSLEDDEQIEPVVVTLDEAFAMMDRGEMRDAKSMLALFLARRRGLA